MAATDSIQAIPRHLSRLAAIGGAVVALAILAGPSSQGDAGRAIEAVERSIAWVQRFPGAAGAAAPQLELVDRHRGRDGVDRFLIRCRGDGRHALLEHREGTGRWWLHAEQDEVAEAPRLSDPRDRATWRERGAVTPSVIPDDELLHLRNALQRWRQRSVG